MDREELKEALIAYRDKRINWIQMGEKLMIARQESIPVDGNYITKNRFKEINRGYNFLKANNLIDDPRVLNAPIRAIAYLAYIKTMVEDSIFEKILNEVLSGRVNGAQIEALSKELQGKGGLQRDNFKSLKERIVKLTNDLSDETKYPLMRKLIAKECSELAQRLNCIIDEKYFELWRKREEFQI